MSGWRKSGGRNELQLLGKVPYFFCYEDVTEAPELVVSTLKRALGAAA